MRARDPIGAWLRDTRAQRRVGREAACACGEARPFALISGRSPPICFRCERLAHGRAPYELNHVFGKRNSALTIRYPINDHRAIFSVKQLDWPPGALDNPNGSPLRASIARFDGLYDNVEHMLAEHIAFSAEALTRRGTADGHLRLELAGEARSRPPGNARRKSRSNACR